MSEPTHLRTIGLLVVAGVTLMGWRRLRGQRETLDAEVLAHETNYELLRNGYDVLRTEYNGLRTEIEQLHRNGAMNRREVDRVVKRVDQLFMRPRKGGSTSKGRPTSGSSSRRGRCHHRVGPSAEKLQAERDELLRKAHQREAQQLRARLQKVEQTLNLDRKT